MALVHAGIGVGEALITGMVLRFILLMRPDMVHEPWGSEASSVGRLAQAAIGGLGIAMTVA